MVCHNFALGWLIDWLGLLGLDGLFIVVVLEDLFLCFADVRGGVLYDWLGVVLRRLEFADWVVGLCACVCRFGSLGGFIC